MATPHTGKFVAYYRVSTQRQGQSGLGLEAQQKAVRDFLNGGNWDLIGEFTEIESGTRRKLKKRPMLDAALALCKKQKATLVIAKLDRLARDLAFIANLLNSPVKFTCADMPQADRVMLQVNSMMGEWEAQKISQRTKEALAAVKARGKKLGNPNPKPASKIGVAVIKAEADEFASRVMPIIRELQSRGATTLRELAEGLTKRGVETPRGNTEWYPSQVSNLIKRGKHL